MSIEIKEIGIEQSAEVSRIFHEYLKYLKSKGLHYEIDEEKLEGFVLSKIKSRAVLSLEAVEGETICGILFASIARISGEYLIMGQKVTGYVNDVYVLPEARGKGIAWTLVKEAEKWFSEMGADSFELHIVNGNEDAETFWKNYGMNPVSTCYFKKTGKE